MRSRPLALTVAAFALFAGACGTNETGEGNEVEPTLSSVAPADIRLWPTALDGEHQRWTVDVIRTLTHDPAAFTQGLERTSSGILESTGRRGESTLRLVDPTTGALIESISLDEDLFGEGLTVVDDEIIQLTWTSGIALRYDADTFEMVDTHSYAGEGWGLCFDGTLLWMSDGSSYLTRRDPESFEPLGGVDVTRNGVAVDRLNELECVDGRIVANIWNSAEIVVINPATGTVGATIDASSLVADIGDASDGAVLNGIADLGDGTLLLGGKLWPRHFVVELIPVAD